LTGDSYRQQRRTSILSVSLLQRVNSPLSVIGLADFIHAVASADVSILLKEQQIFLPSDGNCE
jgi:hypothetical protein